MKEELREKIIAYNKRRKVEKEAYEDFLKIIKPLSELEKILPWEVREILEKYSELGIDAKVAEDYINVLLNYKPKEKQEDISDDDFFKKFEEMRKKN